MTTWDKIALLAKVIDMFIQKLYPLIIIALLIKILEKINKSKNK